METKWRSRARIAGYVDLVLTSMGLFVVLVLVLVVGQVTEAVTDPGQTEMYSSTEKKQLVMGAKLLWLGVAFVAICTFIQLWAAIQLINGTDIGRDSTEALRTAGIWRKITIILFTINILGFLVQGIFFSLVIYCATRGALLFIVHKYMKEVSFHHIPAHAPVEVTVKK